MEKMDKATPLVEKSGARVMTPEEMLEMANQLMFLQNRGWGDKSVDEAIIQLMGEIELKKSKSQDLAT